MTGASPVISTVLLTGPMDNGDDLFPSTSTTILSWVADATDPLIVLHIFQAVDCDSIDLDRSTQNLPY
jgi:hypothetical protein